MNFENSDFLSYADLINLITSDFPSDKADMIAKKLTKHCIIFKQQLFTLQQNYTFKADTEIKPKLMIKVNSLIEQSFKKLDTKDQRLIQAEHKKTYHKIFEISNIEKYYPILYVKLTKDDITFDMTFNQIHFNNGYLDLTDKQFKQRNEKHYITKVIERDYQIPTKEQKAAVLKEIKKIYPIEDDMKCILNVLGSSLTGHSHKDQEILCLLGRGSAGKSFILSLTQETIQCYFREIQSDTFSQSNSKIDKILNTFIYEPQTRLIWINEMKGTKIDDSLFKSFIEGKIQTTKLFEDGSKTVNHYAKCICTSNDMPSIKIDSGIKRRFIGYTHMSEFVDDVKQVDEKKNIFLKDKNLLEKMKSNHLLDAWATILAEYAYNWLNNKKPSWTQNFQQTKDVVMNSNDIFQDFIDSKLNLTENEKDRIGKEIMREAFLRMYPDKHLTTLQVITSLRDKRLEYDGQKRCDGIRGCFTGVRFKGDEVPADINEPNIEELQKQLKEKDNLIDELRKEIAALKSPETAEEKKIKVKPKSKPEVEKVVEKQPDVSLNFDSDDDEIDNSNFIVNFI